jgi:geranylgeranyl diphosphate synthase type I
VVAADQASMQERVEQVFAFVEELIWALPVPPRHRELLQVHVDVGREQAATDPELPAIQLPLLVHAAITGDGRPALPVAGACTLLYLGADLFDNLLDHELPPAWHARESAEANLAVTTLLAALPQLSIARLRDTGTPPARLWALARLFSETLLTMSAGEHEDLLFAKGEYAQLQVCRAIAERKSGSEFALFARAAAIFAAEDPPVIEEYAAFGLCLGAAGQICSDVGDILGGGMSRDLLNGERTLPVVHALYALRGASRDRLQELLVGARESAEYHDEVRVLLADAGSIHYTTLVVEIYLHRARHHLAAASPRGPARQALRTLLDRTSLLPVGHVAHR